MNRKRIEQSASIVRDIGLAALLGGAGDYIVNATRRETDLWGIAGGLVMLVLSVYVSGLEARGRTR